MYLPSNLLCTNYTVVCDQIANKPFVLLNASIFGEYRVNHLCDLQVYSNLSNCNYRIFVEEILLEIGCFIEEIRTTWGDKEVPQTFFHNSLYLRKYDLIRLTPYHWQTCISQFCDITKSIILRKFLQTKKRDYQLVAVSSLAITRSENLAIVTGMCKPSQYWPTARLLWCHKIAKSRVANGT